MAADTFALLWQGPLALPLETGVARDNTWEAQKNSK